MAAPTSSQLTTAGYSLSNGAYSKTFGSITVSFTISDEPGSGLLSVAANGDVTSSDYANAQASLSALGYPAGSSNYALTFAGGLQSYSQSL